MANGVLRYSEPDKLAHQGPYERVAANVVASADWVAARAGIFCCEIRNSDAGNIKIDTETDSGVVVSVAANDVLRVYATKIYNSGTTATNVCVLGFTLRT